MSENERTPSLPVAVKDAPHWRVILRPHTFEAERIPTLNKCWSLVESCRLQLTGWDYPHVDMRNRRYRNDAIESWSDFKGHREYWRFYQSGQFVHLLSFREDALPEESKKRIARCTFMPPDFEPSGCLDIFSILFTLTQVFEFATRLALKDIFGDSLSIIVHMKEVENRVLVAWDWNRAWHGFYPAGEDTLGKEWRLETRTLISKSADLARDASVWFYDRFGWVPPSQLLAEEQRKLLDRRI